MPKLAWSSLVASASRWGEHRQAVHVLLDVVAVVLAILTFAGAGPADLNFHGIFVILTLHAFLFGLPGTLLRIAAASVLIAAYAILPSFGVPLRAFDLTEWPLMGVIAVLVAVMADRRAATSSRYAALYRQTNERLLSAQEHERSRLARDVHDQLGQTLTAIGLTLDAATKLLEPHAPARRRLIRARQLATLALEETRDVAFRIQPTRLHEDGLAAGIRSLASRSGFKVAVRVDPAVAVRHLLLPESETEVFRIVQEALGNATRHSRASRVWIDMHAVKGRLVIEIGDDGAGFAPAAAVGRGLGLAGMHERALVLGASLTIDSAPEMGAIVRLSVPLPPAAGKAAHDLAPVAAALAPESGSHARE